MLSLKLKRIVAICVLLVLGFLLMNPRAALVPLVRVVLMPVFSVFLLDDLLAFRRRGSDDIPHVRFHLPDVFVVLLFAYELLNAYVFHADFGGKLSAGRLSGIFLVYLFGRFYIDTFRSLKIVAYGLTGFGLLVGLFVLFAGIRFFEYIESVGFLETEIVPLRYLFLPGGIMINDWAGILLAFLPFSFFTIYVLPGKWKYAGVVISSVITIAIVYSLSRGAWLALLVVGILLGAIVIYARIGLVRQGVYLIGMYVLLVIFGVYPLYGVMDGMVEAQEESSQIRSVTGRLSRWQNCMDLIHRQPFVGVGNGGYALESMVIANREGSSYTRRVNNVALQIVLEKGVVGLILYLGTLVGVLRLLPIHLQRKTMNDNRLISFTIILLVVGIIGLLIREMTFTTLFESSLCMFLFVVLMFMLVNVSCLCTKSSSI